MGDAFIVRKGGGKSSGAFTWKRSTTAKVFIDYVVSDNMDDYPYDGTQDGYYYELLTKYDIENLSWAEIYAICQAGNAKKLFVKGDLKKITLTTNEVIYAQIVDFEHDTLQDGSTAPISFLMQNCFNTTYSMNSSGTNAGGWKDSALRTTLNSTILNTFPSDLKSLIKYTKKQRYNGGGSVSTLNTVYDKLWIPSEKELFGTYSYTGGSGEGTQYPIFTDNTSRIKYRNGSAQYYWTSSADGSDTRLFVFVDTYGDVSYHYAYNSYGVVAGFCI